MVSVGAAAAYSDTLVCPGCGTPLEVSGISRHLAVWPGILAGAGAAWGIQGCQHTLGWTLPVVSALLAFGITSGLLVMLFADLRKREVAPEPEAATESHPHH